MKKKLALLLAGAMTLSILLSACGTAAEAPSPDAADTPSLSVSAEPTDTPESKEPAAVIIPSAEPSEELSEVPSEEPSEEPSQAAEPAAVTSAAPQASTQAPAPAVSTPKPVVSTPAPAVSAAVEDVPPVSAAPQPAAEPSPEPTPATAPPAATKEAAMAYIGQSVSRLIAAIGQPNGRNYAPSCLGDGEDGELFYNGFTVYTYREGGVETVEDVM